ncbi:FAD-binding oxidoreductase [Noviherbaspirillum denitrificans]|uniref:FAD-linked oxidase n=1 Tax=Noviherbaspirillum denitrificans TaxID=1968433 RepID=A0A254TDX8_9BURK|nr:FAD-binding oxidoreductase [Noviherbaspirillum denitrificans]OWW20814.1 FAD-linked oxidase [Noviherbaspirillum denitrificans]
MRRWNGWGDDTIDFPLQEDALHFLRERVGQGIAMADAAFEDVCNRVPPSRLRPHRLVDISAPVRLRNGLGQSMQDWLRLRYGVPGPLPDGVAFPESSEQVRELLDFAARHDAAVIPYGGGTSVVGHLGAPAGARPVLTINLSRLNRLLDFDPDAQLATFGAGVAGPELEAQLRARGYTLGHFPQSFEYSTLGGWIVTRSSGQQSLRYGRIEQLFAGGRMETPQGTLHIPAFPASAAGIDLRELVLGSEGRIGILTEATVRISRLPQSDSFHAVFFPGWREAETALRHIAQARIPLSMLRLSNPVETMTTLRLAGNKGLIGLLERYLSLRGCAHGKCLLLMGASGDRLPVQQAIGNALRIARNHHGVHAGEAIGRKWKANRFRNVYLRNALWGRGYAVDTVETAIDWLRVQPTMHAIEQAAAQVLHAEGERVHAYTHLSHIYPQGASVYSTFVYRLTGNFNTDFARWRRLKAAVSEAIVASGGTISHQHGVGTDHAPYLHAEKGELGIAAMRQVFRHFDPQGLMNPGKLTGACNEEATDVARKLA